MLWDSPQQCIKIDSQLWTDIVLQFLGSIIVFLYFWPVIRSARRWCHSGITYDFRRHTDNDSENEQSYKKNILSFILNKSTHAIRILWQQTSRKRKRRSKKKTNPSDGNLRLRWKPSMIPKKRIFLKEKKKKMRSIERQKIN